MYPSVLVIAESAESALARLRAIKGLAGPSVLLIVPVCIGLPCPISRVLLGKTVGRAAPARRASNASSSGILALSPSFQRAVAAAAATPGNINTQGGSLSIINVPFSSHTTISLLLALALPPLSACALRPVHHLLGRPFTLRVSSNLSATLPRPFARDRLFSFERQKAPPQAITAFTGYARIRKTLLAVARLQHPPNRSDCAPPISRLCKCDSLGRFDARSKRKSFVYLEGGINLGDRPGRGTRIPLCR